MNSNDEFSRNLNKLLSLLKKIIREQKYDGGEIEKLFGNMDKKSINLNLCFFTFIPMDQEEFAEFEEELNGLGSEADGYSDLHFELNSKDLEFLKKYGIKF